MFIGNSFFAHGSELHETTLDSALHLLGPWYIALPIMISFLAAVGYLAFLVSNKNMGTVILVEALLLLVIGFVFATAYPILSVSAITLGIVLAGFMAFAGLAAGK